MRANGEATRARLIHTAGALFAAGGYEATSLRQVAAAAGVDIATLKYHFGGKPELFVEVFRRGHARFRDGLGPLIGALGMLQSAQELRERLPQLITLAYDHVAADLPFVRISLYRMLEAPEEVIELQDRMLDELIDLLAQPLDHLQQRGVIRSVDARALALLMISGFSILYVAGTVNPLLLGAPYADTAEGRQRFERFFTELLARQLLP